MSKLKTIKGDTLYFYSWEELLELPLVAGTIRRMELSISEGYCKQVVVTSEDSNWLWLELYGFAGERMAVAMLGEMDEVGCVPVQNIVPLTSAPTEFWPPAVAPFRLTRASFNEYIFSTPGKLQGFMELYISDPIFLLQIDGVKVFEGILRSPQELELILKISYRIVNHSK